MWVGRHETGHYDSDPKTFGTKTILSTVPRQSSTLNFSVRPRSLSLCLGRRDKSLTLGLFTELERVCAKEGEIFLSERGVSTTLSRTDTHILRVVSRTVYDSRSVTVAYRRTSPWCRKVKGVHISRDPSTDLGGDYR